MRGQSPAAQHQDAETRDRTAIMETPPGMTKKRHGASLTSVSTLGLAFILAFVAVALLQGGTARAQTSDRIVRLTFDNGPVRGNTARVFDVLRNRRVKATFFVLGRQVRANPGLVRREYREGHSVQNHSYTHADLTTLSNTGIRRELRSTNRSIVDAGVPRPYRFRPPYGATNARVRDVAASLGLT